MYLALTHALPGKGDVTSHRRDIDDSSVSLCREYHAEDLTGQEDSHDVRREHLDAESIECRNISILRLLEA